MLQKKVKENFKLNAAIKMIYLYENNRVIEMNEISQFENGKLYFLLTEIDELPAIHNPTKEPKWSLEMEAFYEALETSLTNPVKKAKQMEKVKIVFDEQDVEFGVLKRLTEPKLQEYGIDKGGLRKAILAVIEAL